MSVLADLKLAFRSFTRAKGLAATVIATALGIGANAAMFSVVQGVRPCVWAACLRR